MVSTIALLTCLLFVQVPDTVALILSPEKPAVVVKKSEAEDLYSKLKDGSDPPIFHALTVALGKLPAPVASEVSGTLSDRERARWQRRPMQRRDN